jgi:hypothetical protein
MENPKLEPAAEIPFHYITGKLVKLDDPQSLIMVAHGFVEIIVNRMVEKKCKTGNKIVNDHRGYPHSTKVLILYEIGYLSDHEFRLLNWFRSLRNDFAHDPFYKLTEDRLSLMAHPDFRKPSEFRMICIFVLLELFMQHVDTVGPVFDPAKFPEGGKFRKSMPYFVPLTNDDPPTPILLPIEGQQPA